MSYNLGDAIGYIKLNIKDFEDKYNEVHSKTEVLENTVDNLGHVFDKAGKLAAAAFASVSAAAVKAVKDVTSVGSSFEAAMSQVAATMGMTAEDVKNSTDGYEKLSNAAREMGETTKYTATEAAEALNYLALAGYSVDESISVLPKVLNVAAAGGMDLAKASDMVTDAMSALGLSVDEAELFVDKLAKTSQKSNTSVSQLGEAILQIGGTAKSLAGGVSELDTALGILANNGIKAAEGGTALRQIILNLTAPTEKAAEYMESIGLSAYDAAGNMKPLNQVFRELDGIMSQFSTQQEKDNVLTSIFDARQLKSARALLANYGDEWDKLYAQIENANGAASIMATTMSTNLEGSLTIAKSALEAVQTTVYETFKNSFTNAVEDGIKSINKLNEVLKSPEMQENLVKIGESISDILLKFTQFLTDTGIPKFIEFASNLEEIAMGLKSALAGLSVALPIAAAGFIACNKTVQLFIAQMIAAKVAVLATNLALLANPYTAVALAVGTLTAAIIQSNQVYKERLNTYVELNQKYQEEYEAAMKLTEAYDEAQDAYEEAAKANDEQINKINTLVEQLGEYANKTELTSGELETAKILIDELNSIYPTNIKLVDGMIVGYDELTRTMEDYCKQLEAEARLTAAKDKIQADVIAKDEAKKILDETAEAAEEATNAYLEAKKKWDYYQSGINNYTMADKKAADVAGMSIKNYLEAQYESAKVTYENAVIAHTESKKIYKQAEDDLTEHENSLLKLRIDAGEKVEGVYSNQQEALIGVQQAYAQEAMKNEQEIHKDEIAERKKQEEEKQKAYDQMWSDLDELERKWQLRQISSEEEYMSQRKALLEGNANEYDDAWVKEYNKILSFEENQQKKRIQQEEQNKKEIEQKQKEQRREFENNIREQVEDLKYRNQIDDTYTKEMMYNDLETIRDGLNKEDSLWKEINKEIILGRKELGDELAKTEVENAEKAFKKWTGELDDVVSEAEKAYQELENSKNKMQTSLISSIELYETTTKKVFDKTKKQFVEQEEKILSSKYLKNQVKELENYNKTLDKLKQNGVGENLMNKILGMDTEKGQEFASMLSKMSKSELKKYNDSYDELIKKSEEMSSKYYDSQISKLKEDFTSKYKSVLLEVPKDVELVGKDTVQGFIDGLNSKSSDSEGAIKTFFDTLISDTKETLGVHSPSTVYYEIGENVINGLDNGITNGKNKIISIFSDLGTQTGKTFIEKFNLELQNIFSSFSNVTAPVLSAASGVTSSLNTQIPIKNNSSNPSVAGYQNNPINYSFNGLTKSDIVSAIKEAQPDGDIVLKVNESEFGRVARSSLNLIAKSSGNMGLKV